MCSFALSLLLTVTRSLRCLGTPFPASAQVSKLGSPRPETPQRQPGDDFHGRKKKGRREEGGGGGGGSGGAERVLAESSYGDFLIEGRAVPPELNPLIIQRITKGMKITPYSQQHFLFFLSPQSIYYYFTETVTILSFKKTLKKQEKKRQEKKMNNVQKHHL